MKITILKKNLKDGLNLIGAAVSEDNNLPILKHILLKTVNNKLQICATNLQLAISTVVSGKIVEEGAVAVPFTTFNGVIGGSGSERVDIEVKNNTVLIKTDNYDAKIQGLPESDFPTIPKIEKLTGHLVINSQLLIDSLAKTSYAVQMSEIRPELNGVFINFQPAVVKMAATDSFRLLEKTIYDSHFKSNVKNAWKLIIPIKTAQEISRIFGGDVEVEMFFDGNQVLVKNSETELVSHVVDGSYPDYEQIIPKATETEISLQKNDLIQALKLVSNFSSKINDIHLRLKDDKKVLEVYSANQYLGENNYLIPVKTKGNGFTDISFNWKYLLDGLKTIKTENLILGFNGESKPAIMKCPEDSSCFYIVMPIKV